MPPLCRAVLPCPPSGQNSVERFTRNPRVRDFTRIRVKFGGGAGAGAGGGTGHSGVIIPLDAYHSSVECLNNSVGWIIVPLNINTKFRWIGIGGKKQRVLIDYLFFLPTIPILQNPFNWGIWRAE